MNAKLFTDGACLGNPGRMGLGIFLQTDEGNFELSVPFGMGTNNVSEYSALIKGLELALEKGVSHLQCFLDSKLVVEQVLGNWKVKDDRLAKLCVAAQQLTKSFSSVSIAHIPRSQNARADALSKDAAYQVPLK